jgi:hypothetical protein
MQESKASSRSGVPSRIDSQGGTQPADPVNLRAILSHYRQSQTVDPVMRLTVRNPNFAADAISVDFRVQSCISLPTHVCATPQQNPTQNPLKSLSLLRVCDQWHRQVYTCRDICTCDEGIAKRHSPVPDDRSHLVSQTLSKKQLSQARVLPSNTGLPLRIFTVQIYIGGFIP